MRVLDLSIGKEFTLPESTNDLRPAYSPYVRYLFTFYSYDEKGKSFIDTSKFPPYFEIL